MTRLYAIVNAGGPPDLRVVTFVFNNEHIPTGSPLRRFMVQWCLWRLQPDWHLHKTVREALQLLPEIIVDLLAEMHKSFILGEVKDPFASRATIEALIECEDQRCIGMLTTLKKFSTDLQMLRHRDTLLSRLNKQVCFYVIFSTSQALTHGLD